jgi:hypothetical protein
MSRTTTAVTLLDQALSLTGQRWLHDPNGPNDPNPDGGVPAAVPTIH